MACETAVVAVGEGGVPESVVAGRTGVLVPRDPARFAEAVGGLLADPSRAADLGRNGRAHVLANWSWDRSAADLARHLASVGRPAAVGPRQRRGESGGDETHRDRTAG
jgi:phosphatidylinositol alpha-1,6-mannosyltransferase